jgi:flagellar biosynthesis chaperone FliJ
MGFQFSLATVLRVRTIHEEREERMLQQILFQIAQTRQAVAVSDASISKANGLRAGDIDRPLIGRDIHDSYGKIEQLKLDRLQLVERLAKLEQLKEMQVKIYDAARQSREMLTDMREKKRGLYDSDVSRREQSVLDDNYIARRGRG